MVRFRRYWQIGTVVALWASLGIGSVLASEPSGASSAPNPAQIAQCTKAATGHKALTKSDINACGQFPYISQHCPSGPGVRVISVNSHNIAIRQGQTPVKLPKDYTVSQLNAVCPKGTKTKTKNGTAAPAPPQSGSSNAALKTAIVPSTFAGTAHPVFSPGALGKLDVVFTGAPYSPGGITSDGTIVPFAMWNGTTKTLDDLSASGTAMVNGTVTGSGNSQDIEPPNLAPGQVAFGIIFFQTPPAPGATFSISPTSQGAFSNALVAQVTQANDVPGQFNSDVVGSITNSNKQPISGPLSATVFCFNAAGALATVETGYASGNGPWAPEATASYDTTLEDPCPTFLVGSSGFTG